MTNPFPTRCYILKQTDKAVLVRPENDVFYSEFKFWIPRKALKKFDMVGYSNSGYPVREIGLFFWFNAKIVESFNKQFKKKCDEGFDYECKLNKKFRCNKHGCTKNQDCNCPWDCEKLLRIQQRRKWYSSQKKKGVDLGEY